MPQASICIPAYNRADMLMDAIVSVRNQTVNDWELIISHDGENPAIRKAVADVGDARIRYFENKIPLRVPGNWNRCIREATADYVLILPDDDVLCPRFLEHAIGVLDANPLIGFAQTGGYNCDEKLWPTVSFSVAQPAGVLTGVDALRFETKWLRCPPATLLFRKKFLLEIGLWREDSAGYFDDWATIVKIAFRHGFHYSPEALCGIRGHGQNYSVRMARRGRDGIGDLINQIFDVFGSCQPLTDEMLEVYRLCLRDLANQSAKAMVGRVLRGDLVAARRHWRRMMLLNPSSLWRLGFVQSWWRQRPSVRLGKKLQRGERVANRPVHLWALEGAPELSRAAGVR